ncbi:EAL domain-containing protein [Caballeronia sp. BR00000012568055]|uniref:EAL domain-containing protein n=1 Tax=Caballeronia sp. BR00000012568055 TaxID=2918761 RepID=UPI0023F888CF|nr:EAL domain-containing protein [Caballeronia sp. BR00000012568055]
MISPSLPELVARARQHPFLGAHIVEGSGEHAQQAIARHGAMTIASAYEPIFDVGTHSFPQVLTASPESAERFGDELGVQAITLIEGDAPPDPFAQTDDDRELVTLDRLARALHAFNFFGPQRHGLLFLRVHERLLKSVKYDHGLHFSSVLMEFGMSPSRVVIELPAAAVAHKTFLGYLTKSYQHYGFKVAGNLPNAGQIMAFADAPRPDFIKMDASAALRDSVVKHLVAYAHRLKIPLIFSNVSDEAQFNALQQFDVHFVQGPVFDAHPVHAQVR